MDDDPPPPVPPKLRKTTTVVNYTQEDINKALREEELELERIRQKKLDRSHSQRTNRENVASRG